MSIVVETFLLCDTPECEGIYGVDNRWMTGKDHRESAKKEGWSFSKGKDYCPICTKNKKSKTTIK